MSNAPDRDPLNEAGFRARSARRWTVAGLARAALLVPLITMAVVMSSASDVGAANKVLLVSWDGVGRGVLEELLYWQRLQESPHACPHKRFEPTLPVPCGEYLTCLPTICRFQIIASRVGFGKTLTRPQHAQMLSGYGPQTTGIVSNSGKRRLPVGYSIYERLRAAVGEDVATVHIAGRKFVSRGVVREAARRGALDILLGRGGPDHGTGRNTTRRGVEAFSEISLDGFLVFIHYKQADVYGHTAGGSTDAYREAIRTADDELGALLEALAEHDVLDETSVYVTTDHGFNGNHHIDHIPAVTETWIASRTHNLLDGISATVVDVMPTVLDEFGVDLSAIEPPLEGVSLLRK